MVEALIDFMTGFYSPESIWDLVIQNYGEALSSGEPVIEIAEPVVAALMAEAAALEEQGRLEEAIKIYEQVIRGSGANGVPEVPHLVTKALFKELSLLLKFDRYDELISGCDQLLNQLRTDEDPVSSHFC